MEYDHGLSVVDSTVREAELSFLATSADLVPRSIPEAYVLPQFAGLEFVYTSVDAVYIWTGGGYQVARDPDDYPLFIVIDGSDCDDWAEFFDRFEMPVTQERQPAEDIDQAIQPVLKPRDLLAFVAVITGGEMPLERDCWSPQSMIDFLS